MKTRPCKAKWYDDGSTPGCPYPAAKGKQTCEWHWLMKQPAHVQKEHAKWRLDRVPSSEQRARVSSIEWPPGERWCAGCQSFIPLFYCSGSRCKACASSAAHGRRVEETYGITPERYEELFEQQGRRCAICRNRPRTMRLAVDHDHKTGEPRGLLCKRCNHDLLGGGHDDIETLYRAIAYLLFPPAKYPKRPRLDEVLPMLEKRILENRLRRVMRSAPVSDELPPF